MDAGLNNASITLSNNAQIAGSDLHQVAQDARTVHNILHNLPAFLPKSLLEHAAILGILTEDALTQDNGDALAKRMDDSAVEFERGWIAQTTADGLQLKRTLRGITQALELTHSMVRAPEARKLQSMSKTLSDIWKNVVTFNRKDRSTQIHLPTQLFAQIIEDGEKGVSLQRYKGLGEMNPGQLWETTLDPDARTLLQVKVDHMDQADEIFTKLMGDVVEPRRAFIQDNALSVQNLDV
jgi:DNA gyrase subunit B